MRGPYLFESREFLAKPVANLWSAGIGVTPGVTFGVTFGASDVRSPNDASPMQAVCHLHHPDTN